MLDAKGSYGPATEHKPKKQVQPTTAAAAASSVPSKIMDTRIQSDFQPTAGGKAAHASTERVLNTLQLIWTCCLSVKPSQEFISSARTLAIIFL
jgi:hypothetical protein